MSLIFSALGRKPKPTPLQFRMITAGLWGHAPQGALIAIIMKGGQGYTLYSLFERDPKGDAWKFFGHWKTLDEAVKAYGWGS